MHFSRPAHGLPVRAAALATALLGLAPALAASVAQTASPADDTAPAARVLAGAARPFSAPAPLSQSLRYRMHSPDVRELQIRLRHARYLATHDAHDEFNVLTREAVRKFQQDRGLRATGVVDQQTWNDLRTHSHEPTAAELNNTDVGPWFVAPTQPGYVMELKHRLRQVGLYSGALSGEFDDATRQAVAAWRKRIGLPASEVMDERTWTPLLRRTRNPRYADLFGQPPASTTTQQLDARCGTGKVVCISKRERKMSYVVDGQVRFTREARFAMPGWDSPEGEFRIWYMNSDTVSKIFGERTPMPYAIFYQGNVAIHFSQDFADKGYGGGSHGCSQLRDYQVAKWLYEQVKVGDRVVVY